MRTLRSRWYQRRRGGSALACAAMKRFTERITGSAARLRRLAARRRAVPAIAAAAVAAALALSAGLGAATKSNGFVLRSTDGLPFVAELSGSGDRWVLLGHMWPTSRHIWDVLEARLAAEGYRVLSWDFRCHGDTRCAYSGRRVDDVPDVYREWEAALDHAIEEGAEEIIGIGASMGGTSLMQVAAYRDEFAAVSAISSPNQFPNKPPEDYRDELLNGLADVGEIAVPKLFMVGATNRCAYLYSERYFEQSAAPARLVVYDTDLHGTTMIDDAEFRADAQREILAFLRGYGSMEGKTVRNEAPEVVAHDECYPPEED